jgi:hypothetical protein
MATMSCLKLLTSVKIVINKQRKGNSSIANENRQFVRSFVHVSQDIHLGNDQKKFMFWGIVITHYATNMPMGGDVGQQRVKRTNVTKLNMMCHIFLEFTHMWSCRIN